MDKSLPEKLAVRLREQLPGPMFGSRFDAHPRYWQPGAEELRDAKPAAVLILLYPHCDEWHFPLTLRPAHMAAHAGQISLPGGAVEAGESSSEAAIREFHEELGDDGQKIELLGKLSPLFVRASNFLVTPWVGVVGNRPKMTPNPLEVQELFEVSLLHLLDPANFGSHTRQYKGQSYTAPHFAFNSHQIWGATCMILGEFVTILEDLS
jgi:8-oxo-dGTP pyrophosphatase MutT (NUDIX family)